MAESGADIAFDVVLLVIAAVAAILWNIGILNAVLTSGLASDPAVMIFMLVVFVLVLAEIYIVNTDSVKAKLNRALSGKSGKSGKKDDFYEKANAQRK